MASFIRPCLFSVRRFLATYHNLVFCLAVLLLDTQAQACAVCGAGQEGSDFSFILSTAILSFVPIILFIIIFYWFKFLKSKRE